MTRQAHLIRSWMARHRITNRAVARSLGLHETKVSQTIHGKINNRRVLRELLRLGCPAGVLGLPEDMKE
ncbi:MAG: hypothetical protein PWQ57_874 [Desulfovibrionales bacterium]|nr:hypothetical protein [Desulfovibrionales bacterium]